MVLQRSVRWREVKDVILASSVVIDQPLPTGNALDFEIRLRFCPGSKIGAWTATGRVEGIDTVKWQ